jgi:branched-chain amino acid transport system ATP-binding protein
VLEVRELDVHYGPIQALRHVSLTVADDEMVALVGANGAGKTTTLRTVSGLLRPTAGEVLFDGEPIAGLPAYKVVERGVAHLPEGRELFADLSVLENLRLGNWTKRKGRHFRAQLDTVMDHFPILRERAGQAAGTLSGGEQQMLGVARALMSAPRLLIVDELSLGLAPKIVAQLFDILREVNAEGTSVLLVEQFVHMALGNTNRAYVLVKGEVAIEGPSGDLLDDPQLMAAYLGEEQPAAEKNGKASRNGKARRGAKTEEAAKL